MQEKYTFWTPFWSPVLNTNIYREIPLNILRELNFQKFWEIPGEKSQLHLVKQQFFLLFPKFPPKKLLITSERWKVGSGQIISSSSQIQQNKNVKIWIFRMFVLVNVKPIKLNLKRIKVDLLLLLFIYIKCKISSPLLHRFWNNGVNLTFLATNL